MEERRESEEGGKMEERRGEEGGKEEGSMTEGEGKELEVNGLIRRKGRAREGKELLG